MAHIGNSRAKAQARWQLNAICGLVAVFKTAREKSDAIENIHQHVRSTCVRRLAVRGCPFEPVEYEIQLCWGGPAVRITGELHGHEPNTARLEYQDWFTPWQELPTSAVQKETMIEYARFFYLGS
jgi:hypothetical protein